MYLKNLRAPIAALVVCCSTPMLHAGTLGVANDFNAFVFGNLTALGGQDTEGRLAVGGNFHASNYAVGSGGIGPALPNSHGTRDDLIVGGDMNAVGKWQVFYGNSVWGTSLTAAPTTPNGNTFQGTPVDFAAAQSELNAKSEYWATLPATGTSVKTWSTLTIEGFNPGLNVFHVDPGDWQSTSDKQIKIPVGSTALINIGGTSLSYFGGLAINGNNSPASSAAMPGVIYNFYEATSIQQNGFGLMGSMLAPKADLLLNAGNVNGVGILNNVVQQNGGEFHNFTFTGSLPTPPIPVPEPTSAALVGIAAMGFVARRRSRSE